MSKVFISGIAGFLGSHLADFCVEQGHEVIGCDNLLGGTHRNVSPKMDFQMADCTDRYAMLRGTKNCDVVFHCAATAYEGLSSFSPKLVTDNIYGSSVTLLSACITNKVERFVFCSSMARYGTNEVPFTEDMVPRPQDPYGIAKVAFEDTLRNLAETHKFEYSIAVPHNIIGPRQKYDDPYRNVASIFINRMLRGLPPIIYGTGAQMRCFSFVQDVVPSLDKLGFDPSMSGEIVNLGPDEEFVTISQLAYLIAELLEFDQPFEFMPDRPREVVLANCSAAKARSLLDYQTKWTLEDGLKEMIDWIREQGPKPFDYKLPLEIINEYTPTAWSKRLL